MDSNDNLKRLLKHYRTIGYKSAELDLLGKHPELDTDTSNKPSEPLQSKIITKPTKHTKGVKK